MRSQTLLAVSACFFLLPKSWADGPAVIYSVNAIQEESKWVNFEVLQTNSYTYLGPNPQQQSMLMTPTQVVSSGAITGNNQLSISSTTPTVNSSALSLSHHNSLSYQHYGIDYPFFIARVRDNVNVNIYLRGQAGTPFTFEVDVTATQTTLQPVNGTFSASAQTTSYTAPSGAAWIWTNNGPTPNGFSVDINGTTINDIITYQGDTYSRVNLNMDFLTDLSYGSTGPNGPAYFWNGTTDMQVNVAITNLGTPVPEATGLLSLLFPVSVWMLRRK